MFFQQGALNVPQIPRFSSFFPSRSQSKPAKNTGIYSVLTKQHAKKHDVLKQFFSSCASIQRTTIFYLAFARNRAKLLN